MNRLRFYLIFSVILIFSCEGPEGLTSLMDISDEPAGSQCPAGGLRISTGIDRNENGKLDSSEITLTKFTCNGADGMSTLVMTTTEPKSANCPNGGVKVQVGKDMNNDGQLSAAEVEQVQYVCDGADGMPTPRELRFNVGGISGFFGDPGSPSDSRNPSIISLFDNFNIKNYDEYDSIVYVVKPVRVYPTVGGGPYVLDKSVILEVVNKSNGNALISGSQLTVTSGDEYVSENFASGIPSGTINLGFSIRSKDSSYYGQISQITLVMFNKH